MKTLFYLISILLALKGSLAALENSSPSFISSNPGAVNIQLGTGELGTTLGLDKDSGVRLAGLWLGDLNYLYYGGFKPKSWSGNNVLELSLDFDMEKICGWKGALFDATFLQFNGSPTSVYAGSVQGYNSLPGPPPLDRSQLYQIWYRQELFDKKLIIRVGKSLPAYDFTNVVKPIVVQDQSLVIPATTALIYTPVFINSSMIGVLPGYYNSVYGICVTWLPTESIYTSYGLYDGNLARGKQTGLRGPEFNGCYFEIAELGAAWELGSHKMPGNIGIGVWNQTGKLQAGNVEEKGMQGVYLFGAQRLWLRHPGVDNSGMIGFYQAGINNSKTLRMKQYLGGGLTFYGLTPCRVKDSFGCGIAWAKLNPHLFKQRDELMLQGYYQAYITDNLFFLTALSYIPHPGASPGLKASWASTARLIGLF